MPDSTSAILADLRDALKACGQFATVTLGDGDVGPAVPRATVSLAGVERFGPDDEPDGAWLRVIARVSLHTREPNGPAAQVRTGELLEAAVEAILADPTRGGRCRHLPIGAATEVVKIAPADVRRPGAAAQFTVRCHARKEPA